MGAPVRNGAIPGFEYKVLEEGDRYRKIIDHDGATKMIYTDGSSSIPLYLKFPIETRQDWDEFKTKFDPADPSRYPSDADWEAWKQRVRNPERVVVHRRGQPVRLDSRLDGVREHSNRVHGRPRRGSRR